MVLAGGSVVNRALITGAVGVYGRGGSTATITNYGTLAGASDAIAVACIVPVGSVKFSEKLKSDFRGRCSRSPCIFTESGE